MKINILLMVIVLMWILEPGCSTVWAQNRAEEPTASDVVAPIGISGFGDFFIQANRQDVAQTYNVGQMEVDLETHIAEKVVIGAAVAYDGENFGLGAFTVDLHLLGSKGDHFHSNSGIMHSGIIVGQFDVPFGIDWHVYPSIDRKLVSAPLVIENTHNGWNDFGVQAYLEAGKMNVVAYATNGFCSEGLGCPVDVDKKMAAVGSRVGIKPHSTLEIGGSWAGFLYPDDDRDRVMAGGDVQFAYQNVFFKGEYVVHQVSLASKQTLTRRGFYGQGLYDFGKTYVVARYGNFSPGDAQVEDLTRLSVGGGWVILDGCELRFEYQRNSQDGGRLAFTQLVVGF
ncbi:MAG: hypothetical protein HOE48_19410 [Candidatus Latescibacteria bacterium]|nr:hypothetical protein [Candidatus Latescibacterota bacterium]MBT4140096.1 hypothetical protein [Candidatus Latescibacterota bacterium]